MDRLAQTLERFNRKERNLLIRHALGHKNAALRLSTNFRQEMSKALGIAPMIAEEAWWWADYHINWLAGALTVYIEGETTVDKPWSNEPLEARSLIEGNQEDIDLIIAWGNELILIEAKAYGAFDNAADSQQICTSQPRPHLLQKAAARSRAPGAFPLHARLAQAATKAQAELAGVGTEGNRNPLDSTRIGRLHRRPQRNPMRPRRNEERRWGPLAGLSSRWCRCRITTGNTRSKTATPHHGA